MMVIVKYLIATTLGIKEIMERFGTEDRAVRWFEQVLWNNVPTCAHCGNAEGNVASPKRTNALRIGVPRVVGGSRSG